MSNAIDLSRLPPPSIIDEPEVESILSDLKADLITRNPDIRDVLDMESEPLTKLLEVWAYRELLLRQQHNERARSLMLAYASDEALDHIGVTYYYTARLVLAPGDPQATPPVAPTMETDSDYKRRLLLAGD